MKKTGTSPAARELFTTWSVRRQSQTPCSGSTCDHRSELRLAAACSGSLLPEFETRWSDADDSHVRS